MECQEGCGAVLSQYEQSHRGNHNCTEYLKDQLQMTKSELHSTKEKLHISELLLREASEKLASAEAESKKMREMWLANREKMDKGLSFMKKPGGAGDGKSDTDMEASEPKFFTPSQWDHMEGVAVRVKDFHPHPQPHLIGRDGVVVSTKRIHNNLVVKFGDEEGTMHTMHLSIAMPAIGDRCKFISGGWAGQEGLLHDIDIEEGKAEVKTDQGEFRFCKLEELAKMAWVWWVNLFFIAKYIFWSRIYEITN